VKFKGGEKENRVYIAIALIILFVIILIVFFNSNQLDKAFTEDTILGTSWYEDINARKEESQLFGLEKFASFTYKNNDKEYPAYVTVTSIKLFFMMNEADLLETAEETIFDASKKGIIIQNDTRLTGERDLFNGHKTTYIIYNGSDNSKEPFEKIRIIGETWNCGNSGTSIICIGVAQITDNVNNNSIINTTYWDKIVGYQNGLIYNVKCH
jgi:hypothetical protein